MLTVVYSAQHMNRLNDTTSLKMVFWPSVHQVKDRISTPISGSAAIHYICIATNFEIDWEWTTDCLPAVPGATVTA